MLAARSCDRLVIAHPLTDANGRIRCLVLNAILIKYAGTVVILGEKGDDRDQYNEVASESTKVKGHPGQI